MAMDEFITIHKKDLDAISNEIILILDGFGVEIDKYDFGLPITMAMDEMVKMVKNKLIEKSI